LPARVKLAVPPEPPSPPLKVQPSRTEL
jgi:hypothetical protein